MPHESASRKPPTTLPRALEVPVMARQAMDEAEFAALRASAEVLEEDGFGLKVLQLADGRIMKLFRLKGPLSSSHWLPYSARFVRNAGTLQRLGIPTVADARRFELPSLARTGVLYQPLPGETLRRLGVGGALTEGDCALAGQLLAQLHREGILFRSIHLGNIVKTPAGAMGLIDIADLSRQPLPLLRSQRLRNFQHMFRPDEDHLYLKDSHKQALIDSYLEHAGKLASDQDFRQRVTALARVA